jgi:hypothetical protein
MLKVYVVDPDLARSAGLSVDCASDLVDLLERMESDLTFVAVRSDWRALAELLGRLPFGNRFERARERILGQLGASGPGVVAADPRDGMGAEDAVRELLRRFSVDAVICRDGERAGALASKLGSGSPAVLAVSDKKLHSPTKASQLEDLGSEAELDNLLERFFQLDSRLLIIDPYLGAEATRGGLDPRSHLHMGLSKLLDACARAGLRAGRQPEVTLVFDPNKVRVAQGSGSTRRASPQEQVSAFAEVEQRLRDLLRAKSKGPADVRIEVRATQDSFTHRGLKSSRRHWIVEHNLRELGEFLDALRQRRKAATHPIVSLLDEQRARRSMSILSESAPNGAGRGDSPPRRP